MKIKLKSIVVTSLVLGSIMFILFYDHHKGKLPFNTQISKNLVFDGDEKRESVSTLNTDVRLDVPLINQFEPIYYQNGCEVASLTMILNYYGYDVEIADLIEWLEFQPLYVDQDHHGDPRIGFVGNIYEGNGAMGVDVEPITKVAEHIVKREYHIVSGREKTFGQIINVVKTGTPVWIISTLDLQVPTDSDFMSWYTLDGEIQVTPLVHSVVITGIEGETIFVNDPYGYKDREVSYVDLKSIYNQMGQQYLYLTNNSDAVNSNKCNSNARLDFICELGYIRWDFHIEK